MFAYLSSAAFPGVLVPGSQERDAGQALSLAAAACSPGPSAHTAPRHPQCCLGVPGSQTAQAGFDKVTEAVKTAV